MVIMGHFIKARSPSPKPSFEHIEDIECLSKTKKKVHDEGTNVVLCFISKMIGLMGVFLAFVVAVTLIISKDASPVNDICHGHMVYYSPVTKHINTSPHHVFLNGGLNITSIYTGSPSTEVDAAWNRTFYDMGVFSLPEREALNAGRHKDDIRIPEGYKYAGEYMACHELPHQLHCVNFLRKAAWVNYPYYKSKRIMEFNSTDKELEHHLNYCIEILRQVLICNADPGAIGYRPVRDYGSPPFPDYDTLCKCGDWGGIVEYAYENQVSGHPTKKPFAPEKQDLV